MNAADSPSPSLLSRDSSCILRGERGGDETRWNLSWQIILENNRLEEKQKWRHDEWWINVATPFAPIRHVFHVLNRSRRIHTRPQKNAFAKRPTLTRSSAVARRNFLFPEPTNLTYFLKLDFLFHVGLFSTLFWFVWLQLNTNIFSICQRRFFLLSLRYTKLCKFPNATVNIAVLGVRRVIQSAARIYLSRTR